MGARLAKIWPNNEEPESEEKKIIFIYDFKSTSKHFICGTNLVDDIDNLKKYDDYDDIKHKRGLEIRSLGFYRDDNRIVGYEVEYHDAKKTKFTIKRIAHNYRNISKRKFHVLKLEYNEHLADIEVIYSFNDIKHFEIGTSKANVFKVGVHYDNCYSSFSKIDVTQRAYTPIIGFASTFSNDALKELFIYRCPVRISKKKKKKLYTVNEINVLKENQADPEIEKAVENISMIRDVTKKSVVQMRALKAFQAILEKKSKKPGAEEERKEEDVEDEEEEEKPIKDNKKENKGEEQEDYEFGIDSDEEEEKEKKKKEDVAKNSPNFFSRIFRKDSYRSNSSSSPRHTSNTGNTGNSGNAGGRGSFFKDLFFKDAAKRSPNTSPKSAALKKQATVTPMTKVGSLKRLFASDKKDKKDNDEEEKDTNIVAQRRKSAFAIGEKLDFLQPNKAKKSLFAFKKNTLENIEEQKGTPKDSPESTTSNQVANQPFNQIIPNNERQASLDKGGFTAAFQKYEAFLKVKEQRDVQMPLPRRTSEAKRTVPNELIQRRGNSEKANTAIAFLSVPFAEDRAVDSPELKPGKTISLKSKVPLNIPPSKQDSSDSDDSDSDHPANKQGIIFKRSEDNQEINPRGGFNLLSLFKDKEK